MDCTKLHEDITKLETIQAKFSSKLESATASGLGKTVLDGLYQEASTTSESLLEQYAYDLVEQNLKDKSGRNTAFLNSTLERYWKEQERAEQSK